MSEEIKDEELVPEEEVEAKPEKKKRSKLFKDDEALVKLQAEYDKLQEELQKNKDTQMRVLAEYDNFRKRSAAEKTSIYGNATADAVNLILPVADNMERALCQENASAEDLRKGIELIWSQFGQCFEKLGITAVGEVGEAFDPAMHNAVSHIDSEDLGENTISAVFQKGYKLGDKVVRHAMVQVAN